MKLPLASSTWDHREIEAIQRVIASGVFTMGEEVARFQEQFAKYLGLRHCVMVNSGSSANLLMVAALCYRNKNPLRRGDEVIVPAVSWATTYSPLQQHGLKVKFVDIDLETLNFDLQALACAVTPSTRVILAVNLLGNPNHFAEIHRIIGSRNIILLEDNCESLGASFGSQPTGTFGLMASFSFFYSHHLSTMEGGMVATDDSELGEILLCLRAHGWTRNLPKNSILCGERSDDWFDESFRFLLPGYNLRPLEMSGAAGQEQLKKLEDFVAMRRKNAQLFQQLFRNEPRFHIQKEIGQSSWFGFSFVIRPESGVQRDEVVKHLMHRGIDCRPIVAGDFTRSEALRFFDYEIAGEMRNAQLIGSRGFFVGNHHYDISKELEYLADCLREYPSQRTALA